jgi:RNA recognition motif-containing protein
MESLKRHRFEKVASKRVQKIIDFIRLLGNCSNKNNYEYTDKDVELMFKEISKALKESRVLYDKNINKSSKGGFKF